MKVEIYMYVYICGDQRSASGYLETRGLLNRLHGYGAPGSLLLLPSLGALFSGTTLWRRLWAEVPFGRALSILSVGQPRWGPEAWPGGSRL